MIAWLQIVLQALGVTAWLERWIQRKADRQDGKNELQVEIDKETIDAKNREARDYAAPRSADWPDIVKRLQRPSE